MNIIKVEPTSLVDWPGEICSVIHVKGCNFKCNWCFNKSLISFDMNGLTNIGIKGVVDSIPKHIHHVIITGGEPFSQNGIIDFIHKLKALGYKVGVHTNGSFPKLLDKVIYALDYVAMDVKGTLNNYQLRTRCGDEFLVNNIFESIVLITDSIVPHEFRTTAAPGVTKDEIYAISKMLNSLNAKAYYLQHYIEVRDIPNDDYLTVDELRNIAKDLPLCSGVRG